MPNDGKLFLAGGTDVSSGTTASPSSFGRSENQEKAPSEEAERARLTPSRDTSDDPHMEERVSERIAKLEEAFSGARYWLGILLTAIFAFISIIVSVSAAFIIFEIEDGKEQVQLAEQRTSARMDSIEAKIDALPGQLTDIANAITNAITASRPTAAPPAPRTPPSE